MSDNKKTTESEVVEKSVVAQKEEQILAFWDEHKIFKQTVERDAPNGDFVFYDRLQPDCHTMVTSSVEPSKTPSHDTRR